VIPFTEHSSQVLENPILSENHYGSPMPYNSLLPFGIALSVISSLLHLTGCTDDITETVNNENTSAQPSTSSNIATNGSQLFSSTVATLDFKTVDSSLAFDLVSTTEDLGFTVTSKKGLAEISPAVGQLEGGRKTINVTIDRSKLDKDELTDTITVISGIGSVNVNINIDNTKYSESNRFSDKVKNVMGYRIEPGICEITGGEMNCRVKITNTEGSGPLTIYSGRYVGPYSNTRVIKNGKEYGGYAVTFAGNTKGNETTGFLLTDVPIEASIKFSKIPSGATEFDVFELKFRNGRSYEGDFFSAVWKPITTTNQNID
jgi:hypothetical protein